MKGAWSIAGLSAIGCLLVSCSGTAVKNQAAAPTASPNASRPVQAPSPAASPQILPVPPVPPNLLPPVNVPQRIAQTPTGQGGDPFTSLPVTPASPAPLQANVAKPVKKVATAKSQVKPTASKVNTTKTPKVETTQSAQTTSQTPSSVATTSGSKGISKPTPLPTDLADAVVVSGVVQTQGRISAIVQAPNEPTSRSVKPGDYLSGGKVRVKRILTQGDPMVVLEQNGIEVVKSVGFARAS